MSDAFRKCLSGPAPFQPASNMRRLIIPSALLILGFLATYLVTTRARRAEPGPGAPASGASSARRSHAVAHPPGMVWVPGGEFTMGSDDPEAAPNERPAHRVRVDGFWMDVTEVTNAQFRRFVEATGYVTTAERPVVWEQLRKELPPGTPKPPDDRLAPGSLVFNPPGRPVSLDDHTAWWRWVPGASWRHPEGPGSSIEGKDDHPVILIFYSCASVFDVSPLFRFRTFRGTVSAYLEATSLDSGYSGVAQHPGIPHPKEADHAAYRQLPFPPTPLPPRLHRTQLRHLPLPGHRLVPLPTSPLRHRTDPVQRRHPPWPPQSLPPLLQQRRLVAR